MKKDSVIERCPKCDTEHLQKEYKEYIETHPHLYDGKQVTICGAPDVKCKCGLELEWVVPFFRMSASGYLLKPKPDYRNFRKAK